MNTAWIGLAGVVVGAVVTGGWSYLLERQRRADAKEARWHDLRRDLYARLIEMASEARNAARSNDAEVRNRTCQSIAALTGQVILYAGTKATADAATSLGEAVQLAVIGGQVGWDEPTDVHLAFMIAVRKELGLEELL